MGQLISSVSKLGLHSFRSMNFVGPFSKTPELLQLLNSFPGGLSLIPVFWSNR